MTTRGNISTTSQPAPAIVVRVTSRKGAAARSNVCWAARQLGVTRQHLYLVLRGQRRSPRIERWLGRNLRRTA
jgi:DNA-binding phage protein